MLHVGLSLIELLLADQPFDPARIEIDEVAGAAAHVGQVLDREPQSPWSGRTNHQPVMISREFLIIQRIGKLAVVHLVVVPADALLGHASGTTGLEDVERLALELLGHPHLRLQIAKPFILEMREFFDNIVKTCYLLNRIPIGLTDPIKPKRTTCFRREMPLHYFQGMGIKLHLGLLNFLI